MRQLIHLLRTGEAAVVDVPRPATRAGEVLLQRAACPIPAGAKRMLVESGKGNLRQRAKQQLERLREAINKVATDSFMSTMHAFDVTVSGNRPSPFPFQATFNVPQVSLDVLRATEWVRSSSYTDDLKVA